MALSYPRHARNTMLLGCFGLLVLVACAPKQRDLTQLTQSDADGGKAGAGGQSSHAGSTAAPTGGVSTTQAGATSTGMGGSGAVAGTSISGGQSALAGQPSIGGAVGIGGGAAVQGGSGGVTSSNGGASGALGIGGATIGIGGVTNTGGAVIGVGGVANTGGAVGAGGVPGSGGAIIGVGGVANTGGIVGAGGATSCVPTGVEVCNDGVDNDCNGTIDCPNVAGRFPEPGRAASGDDVWVQLTAPAKLLKQVECRSGKPNLVGSKLWLVCDPTNPKALTVYSMGLAEAKLPENNGVTQFDFRFVYTDGSVSDPRSIVYYAHNSLWDANKGTSSLLCNPVQADSRYFDVARGYIAPDASTPTFAADDAQLKNPFIRLRFYPPRSGNNYAERNVSQEIKVLSLRHRFVIDSGKQMLLVTRQYQSTRSGTCEPARIGDRDTDTESVTTGTPPTTTILYHHKHRFSTCHAIVLNRTGTGVCLQVTSNGVVSIPNMNSNKVITFLQSIGIPWPKGDPMMWHKLFDDRPSRASLDFFSPKCVTEDLVCRAAHTQAPVLPDSSDLYFANP